VDRGEVCSDDRTAAVECKGMIVVGIGQLAELGRSTVIESEKDVELHRLTHEDPLNRLKDLVPLHSSRDLSESL
jgi:hypothetical protein